MSRERWRKYLVETTTYGTFYDRRPEYATVHEAALGTGLFDDRQLVVDVGAAWGDFGRHLYLAGWEGQYVPVDGAVDGSDLNVWEPGHRAEWFVSIETVEHLDDPLRLVSAMQEAAEIGVIVTTPNPATHDVTATDATHVTPVCREDLEDWGFTVSTVEFNGRGNGQEGDTLVGVWLRR